MSIQRAGTSHAAAALVEGLRGLRSSGAAGFEGLVARLLSASTGWTFRLAASGSQEGEDLSARPRGELVVAVECKRFGAARQFSTTELMGKMDDAIGQDGRLDLWMLATSRQVPAQVHRQLLAHGERLGISVAFLDHDPYGLGALPVLCAQYPDIIASAFPGTDGIADLLDEIRRAPRFQAVLDELRRELSPADLGYAAACAALRARITSALGDPEASEEEFAQKLLPRAPGVHDLPRIAIDAALDGWWSSWPDGGRILVLRGEEGTGKSWCLASWLARRILAPGSAPLVLWCGSGDFEFSTLRELGARLLELRLPLPCGPERAQLTRKLMRWSAAGGPGAPPRVVFVVDGLNERPRPNDWRHWLLAARRELAGRLGGAALILTCRTSTWADLRTETRAASEPPARLAVESIAAPHPGPHKKIAEVSVADFTDQELERMLDLCGLNHPPLDPTLRTLLRRPRYFQLAARYWPHYASSGDFTVARLFFEEWRDRQQSRTGEALPDERFHLLLREVAQEFRDRALGRRELAQLLDGHPDIEQALEELISAGVFVPVAGAPGSFRLESHRLYLGLGLLLVKNLSDAAGTLEQALETAATEIEAGGGADDTSRIVANATCIALTSLGPSAPPRNAVMALLLTLARQPNAADAWEKAQPWMYYPANPALFRELAEAEWSRSHPDQRARERIGFAFSWIAEKWPADAALAEMCRRWLRFVHPIALQERRAGQPQPDAQPALAARIAAVRPFTEQRAITPVPVDARRLLGLADLALSCICEAFIEGAPRDHYLSALGAWAVSNAVLGRMRNTEQVRWVVRFGGAALWPRLADLAAHLAALGEPLLRDAAALLLRLEGSAAAREHAEQLQPLRAPATQAPQVNMTDDQRGLRRLAPAKAAAWLATHAIDPALALERLSWRHRELLRSIDVADVSAGRQPTGSDLTLEASDVALSRTAPYAYARLARQIVDTIVDQLPNRSDLRTDVLGEHFLLLTRRHLARARALLPDLERRRADVPRASRRLDWDVADVVLASLEKPRSQVRFLLGRHDPDDAAGWADLFAPLPPAGIRAMIRSLPRSSGLARRRLLWFPWREAPALSARERQSLAAAARDSQVGTIAGLVPQHAQDPELLIAAIRDRLIDDEWLSRILALHPWARTALAAAPPEVRSRLGPEAATWVLAERGLATAEVRQWALNLDHALRHPPATQEISAAGRIAVETVSAAIAIVPEVTDAWIAALTGDTELSHRLVDLHFSLVSALLLGLLNRGDDRGVAAFSRLLRPQVSMITFTDQPSGVPSLWFLPFKARDTPAARQAARLLFNQAFTDDDLQRLAYAASLHGRLDALIDQLEPAPTPDLTLIEARAVALLALAPASERAPRTIQLFGRSAAGWLPNVATWALSQQQKDAWACHWFRRFLEDPDAVQAWAAFRLCLHCVDRRWLLWHRAELERARDHTHYETRRRHLELNQQELDDAIKEQSDLAAKTLCGHSVPSDLVPWKRGWHL